MGSGVMRRYLEAKLDFKAARNIFISHRHPDHCADLIPYLFGLHCTPDFKSAEPLRLFAPLGFREILAKMTDLFPWIAPKSYELCLQEVGDDAISGKGWTVQSRLTLHADLQAVSYRLEAEGKVVAYTGDSAYCEALVENVRNADLLIAECSYPEGDRFCGIHLNAVEVGKLAQEARVKRVLLTHLFPPCDEVDMIGLVKRNFSGVVEKAEDLMQIMV